MPTSDPKSQPTVKATKPNTPLPQPSLKPEHPPVPQMEGGRVLSSRRGVRRALDRESAGLSLVLTSPAWPPRPRGVGDGQAWVKRALAWYLSPLSSICDLNSRVTSLPESRFRHPHSGHLSYRTVCHRTQEGSRCQGARQATGPSLGWVFLPLSSSVSSSVQWVGLTSWALQQLPARMRSELIGPKSFAGPVQPVGPEHGLHPHAENRPVSLCLSKFPTFSAEQLGGAQDFPPQGFWM